MLRVRSTYLHEKQRLGSAQLARKGRYATEKEGMNLQELLDFYHEKGREYKWARFKAILVKGFSFIPSLVCGLWLLGGLKGDTPYSLDDRQDLR